MTLSSIRTRSEWVHMEHFRAFLRKMRRTDKYGFAATNDEGLLLEYVYATSLEELNQRIELLPQGTHVDFVLPD